MDKQFQRLLELAKKKDAGTITEREERRLDKITYRYITKCHGEMQSYQAQITKCHEEMQAYQAQIIKLTEQLFNSSQMLRAGTQAFEQTYQFLKDKGLFEEFKALNEKNQKV